MSPHPEHERWADHLRGLGSEAERAELTSHLEGGCDLCAGRVAALERVLAVAAADLEQAPAASALRVVRALTALGSPRRRSLLGALVLELSADTALGGAPSGIRSGEPPAGRQLAFTRGGWSLEVTVEVPVHPRAAAELIGTCGDPAGRPLTSATVMAVAEERIVGHQRTGEIGEFRLAGLPAEQLELWLLAGGEPPLVAELDLTA